MGYGSFRTLLTILFILQFVAELCCFILNWFPFTMSEKVRISIEQVLASKSVIDFIESARSFCSLLETQPSGNPKEFLEIIQGQLLTLYTLGIDLPDVFVESDIDFDTAIPREQRQALTKFISERVPFSYYPTILDPLDIDTEEMGIGDLTDDLGDIYYDLKKSLILYENENMTVKGSAVWQFKFDFGHHWQEHCINALHVIFYYLFENR